MKEHPILNAIDSMAKGLIMLAFVQEVFSEIKSEADAAKFREGYEPGIRRGLTMYKIWRRLVWLPTYIRLALRYHSLGFLKLWWDRGKE